MVSVSHYCYKLCNLNQVELVKGRHISGPQYSSSYITESNFGCVMFD